jgi:hypothetical protein
MSFRPTDFVKALLEQRDPDAVMFHSMSGYMTARELLAYFEKEEQEDGPRHFLKSYTASLFRKAQTIMEIESYHKLRFFQSFTNYFKKQPLFKTGRYYEEKDSWSFFTDTCQYSVTWRGEDHSYVFEATGPDMIRCISFNNAFEEGYNTIEKLYQYLFEGVKGDVDPLPLEKFGLMPNIPKYKEVPIPELLALDPKNNTREGEIEYMKSLNIPDPNKVTYGFEAKKLKRERK